MNHVIKWGIVLIAVSLLVLLRKQRTKRFDPSGKTRVFAILHKFNQEKYTILHYVYLPYVDMDGRTIDIDHIVVSVYGIFVIGVQNLKGCLIDTIEEEWWMQHVGNRAYQVPSPVLKNDIRVEAMQDFLMDEHFPKMPIYSIVAFPDETDLKVESGNATITRYAELRDTIQNCYTKEMIHPTAVKKIAETIEECTRLHATVAMEHMLDAMENDAREKSQIQKGICTKCGRPLVIRHGKFIDYYSCSGYPECNFTVDMEAVKKDD